MNRQAPDAEAVIRYLADKGAKLDVRTTAAAPPAISSIAAPWAPRP